MGCHVAVQDLDLQAARTLAGELAAAGGVAAAFGGDVTDERFADEVFDAVARSIGPPDILVNNAAVQEVAEWEHARIERLLWQWRGNVLTPWLLTRRCVPAMRERRWGRVIFLSSVQGRRGNPNMLGYSTTKAAVNNIVTGLAAALGPDGITVNAIAPGYFDTFRNRDDFPDEATKRQRGLWIPLQRVGEPDDVSGAVRLLAGDHGAYITGQVIYIDGGLTLR